MILRDLMNLGTGCPPNKKSGSTAAALPKLPSQRLPEIVVAGQGKSERPAESRHRVESGGGRDGGVGSGVAEAARNNSVGFLGEKDHLYWPFPDFVQETDIVRHGGKAGCVQVGL